MHEPPCLYDSRLHDGWLRGPGEAQGPLGLEVASHLQYGGPGAAVAGLDGEFAGIVTKPINESLRSDDVGCATRCTRGAIAEVQTHEKCTMSF